MANDINRSIKIYIDSTEAAKSVEGLEANIKKLEAELKALNTDDPKQAAQAKKLQSAIESSNKTLNTYKAGIAETDRVLKNLSGATYNELIAVKKRMTAELNKTTRGTAEYNMKLSHLKTVSREVQLAQKEMRIEVGAQATATGRASDFFRKYIGVFGGGLAAITGATMAFSKFREERDKLEASSANLKALTGLGDDDVKQLENAAKRLSTTITSEGVRIKQSAVEIDDSFAIIGSQRPELLKNADALEAVTQDAIYLSIAAKDKLEPAAKALTTVMNQMNLSASESRRIINAIASGSQAGAANVGYITDAFEKSGTTANLMNISLEQLIGTIEAVAPKYSEASVAGNSLDKVFLKLKEKQIGYKNGVFDLNAAIDEMSARFKKGESAVSIFGSEHAKMAEILIQNKGDIDKYTAAVTGSNKAVEQAQINSNTNEVKRAQARNRLTLKGIELIDQLTPALVKVTDITADWSGRLLSLLGFLTKNYDTIGLLIAAVAGYTLVVKAQVIADKAHVLWNDKVVVSLKRVYKTVLNNPYTAAGAVILTLLLYLRKANEELTQMAKVQGRVNAVENEGAKNITAQKTELEQFVRLARNENETKERRLAAIKKINEISPEYLGNLTLEEINTDKATTAINKYIDSIYQMAKAQAAKDQLVEIEREKIRLDTDPEAFDELVPIWEKMEVGLFGIVSKEKANELMAKMVSRGRSRRDKVKADLDAQAEALRQMIAENSVTVLEDNENDPKKPKTKTADEIKSEKLKAVDDYVMSERLKLQDSYLNKLLDKEAFNKQMEMLELEALNRRFDIYNLDKDKQAEIQDKIQQYKMKILEQTAKFEESQQKYRDKAEKKESDQKEKNLNSELKRQVKRANDEHQEALNEEIAYRQKMVDLAQGFSSEIGNIVGGAIAGNSDIVKSSLVSIINMGLDALKIQCQMAVAGATMQSLAQPDSVATMGAAGFARAAILCGLIEAAFGAVKGIVGSLVGNIGSGASSSDATSVSGTSDASGSRVTNGYQVGGHTGVGDPSEVAGVVHRSEYVVPAFVLNQPAAMNHVQALEAMRQQRTSVNVQSAPTAGFAQGGYTGESSGSVSAITPDVANKLLQKLDKLDNIKAYVVYSDLEKKKKTLEKSRKVGGK